MMRKKVIAVSSAAILAVALYEGYREQAYYCPAGKPTIGYGTTVYEDGTPVKIGDHISRERATIKLQQDMDRIAKEIAVCIGDVPLYQHEFDAYTSLAYNIGSVRFCQSRIAKRLHSDPPDYAGACAEILRWDRAAGIRLPGLVKRRQAEYQMCIGAKDVDPSDTK